jgi:hypothetical protein
MERMLHIGEQNFGHVRDIDEAANVRFLDCSTDRLEFSPELKILEIKPLSELDDFVSQICLLWLLNRRFGISATEIKPAVHLRTARV